MTSTPSTYLPTIALISLFIITFLAISAFCDEHITIDMWGNQIHSPIRAIFPYDGRWNIEPVNDTDIKSFRAYRYKKYEQGYLDFLIDVYRNGPGFSIGFKDERGRLEKQFYSPSEIVGPISPVNLYLEYDAPNFISSVFDSSAFFGWASMHGSAYFDHATFDSIAIFNGTTFNKSASFIASTFSDTVLFWNTLFLGPAIFWQSTFDKPVQFVEAQFKNAVNFHLASINSNIIFSGTTFDSTIDFTWANFRDTVSFNGSKIKDNVNFRATTFHNVLDLRDTQFTKGVNFTQANLKHDVWIGSENSVELLDFTRANFASKKAKVVLFAPVSLKIQIEKFRHIILCDSLDYYSKKEIITTLKENIFSGEQYSEERFELDFIFAKSTLFQNIGSIYIQNHWYQIYKWPVWIFKLLYFITLGLGYRPLYIIPWMIGSLLISTAWLYCKMPITILSVLSDSSEKNLKIDNYSKLTIIVNCFYACASAFFGIKLKKEFLSVANQKEQAILVIIYCSGLFLLFYFILFAKQGAIFFSIKSIIGI